MRHRSEHFPSGEPFADNVKLNLRHAESPLRFLNPTTAHFTHSQLSGSESVPGQPGNEHVTSAAVEPAKARSATGHHVQFLWRSRDSRKGRHALLVNKTASPADAHIKTPRRTSHPREILKGVWRTFTCFPIWDISWLVAFIFTGGSIVWVINGFFAWLPLEAPETEFDNEILYGGGITAFIGAIVFFEVGSILLVIEAINTDRAGCFGWAVEQILTEHKAGGTGIQVTVSDRHCKHHHQNKNNLVGKPATSSAAESDIARDINSGKPAWQWIPSLHELRSHYVHELGFLAGVAQLFGATVFGVSGFTALPGINDRLTPQSALNGAYWIPQVIGGSGFIVSSSLYMLETQRQWYRPAWNVLGWHIAFWNLVGAVGFTLCGALGMAYGNSGAQYQAALATFWGSWAFLIGSYLQLYESLDKYPVEEISEKR